MAIITQKNVLLKNPKQFPLCTCTIVLKELQHRNATFHIPHLNGSCYAETLCTAIRYSDSPVYQLPTH